MYLNVIITFVPGKAQAQHYLHFGDKQKPVRTSLKIVENRLSCVSYKRRNSHSLS